MTGPNARRAGGLAIVRGVVVRLAASLAVLVAVAGFAPSQAHPNFAGHWSDGTVRGVDYLAGVIGPEDITITQDPTQITIERSFGRKPATITVRLDGKTSKNMLDPGPNVPDRTSRPRELRSKAAWAGSRLTISTETRDAKTMETLSLQGENLVVERTMDRLEAIRRGGLPPGPMVRLEALPVRLGGLPGSIVGPSFYQSEPRYSKLIYTRASK